MVSVVPRVGSFGAPYKHNNNAKQAHFWKLQLQNFTCLICIRRVKIPSFGSCHVFLITADWFWTSEFCEANNFVVTCCKCLGHAAAPLKLESNYSSCSPGHFPLRHKCLWFMIGRVTWEKPFIEWNLFYFAGLQQMHSTHKAASFQDFERKSEVQSNLKQLPLLTLYRSRSKDTPAHRTHFSHNVVWRVYEDQLRMAPHMHQTLSVPWCKRWCKYNPINESKPKNCLEHLKQIAAPSQTQNSCDSLSLSNLSSPLETFSARFFKGSSQHFKSYLLFDQNKNMAAVCWGNLYIFVSLESCRAFYGIRGG